MLRHSLRALTDLLRRRPPAARLLQMPTPSGGLPFADFHQSCLPADLSLSPRPTVSGILPWQHVSPVRSLTSCFAELPALQGAPAGTGAALTAADAGNVIDEAAAAAASDLVPGLAAGAGALSALPQDVLRHVMRRMPPPDVRALAGTCRLLRDVARDVLPGLLLDLFPHQVPLSFHADPGDLGMG